MEKFRIKFYQRCSLTMRINLLALELYKLEFEPQLCLLVAVRFWVSYLPSLRDSLSNSTQNLVECKAHERCSAREGGQWVGGTAFPA